MIDFKKILPIILATPEMQYPPDAMNGGQIGMHLPDGTDLRQVTVLSKPDWDRIQQQLHRKQMEAERMQRIHEEREAIKNRSKEMVKDWGNTIKVSFIFHFFYSLRIYFI